MRKDLWRFCMILGFFLQSAREPAGLYAGCGIAETVPQAERTERAQGFILTCCDY
jgi:hypothetical protein